MPRYIDADALANYANNQVGGTITANEIMRFPIADVEPVRHGHWTNGNCGDYVCSVCGWAFSDELPYMAREYDAETEEIMRYCMHCGARLELQGGEEMDIYEEIKKIKEENAALRAKVEELTEKHWEECRQIALYDDELKEAKKNES